MFEPVPPAMHGGSRRLRPGAPQEHQRPLAPGIDSRAKRRADSPEHPSGIPSRRRLVAWYAPTPPATSACGRGCDNGQSPPSGPPQLPVHDRSLVHPDDAFRSWRAVADGGMGARAPGVAPSREIGICARRSEKPAPPFTVAYGAPLPGGRNRGQQCPLVSSLRE